MRTFAMTVVTIACAAMAIGWAYFLVALALPASTGTEGGFLIGLAAVFTAIFAALAVASARWSGAVRSAGFWLVGAVLGALVILLNAPFLPSGLAHPADTNSFLVTIVVVASGVAMIIGGIAAFRDVSGGRVSWTRDGRAGWIATVVVGAVAGAALTSILAGAASGGTSIGHTPTTTAMVTAENTKFVEPSLDMKAGEVLGLFVTNKDNTGHSFDIDSLGIHVQLPPRSTIAVGIEPSGPGSLEFYCSIPGHREAGMVGTINVE